MERRTKDGGRCQEFLSILCPTAGPKNCAATAIPWVGDDAFVNLFHVVRAGKGNFGITIDLRYYHDSETLTKLIANTALDRVAGLRAERKGATACLKALPVFQFWCS